MATHYAEFITELQEEVKKLKANTEEQDDLYRGMRTHLLAENDSLKDWLRQYGTHQDENCIEGYCECGLTDLIGEP